MRHANSIKKLLGIALDNFRVFENFSIDFKPITILTGPNNSGKSSVIKALLLIDDNIKNGHLDEAGFNSKWDFNNEVHNLSSTILCRKNIDKPMGIGLKVADDYYYLFPLIENGVQLHDAAISTSTGGIVLIQKEQNVILDLGLFKGYLAKFIQDQKEILEYKKSEEHYFYEAGRSLLKVRNYNDPSIDQDDLKRLEDLYKEVCIKVDNLKNNNENTTKTYNFELKDDFPNEEIKDLAKPIGSDITNLFFKEYFSITKPFKEDTIFKLFPPLQGFNDKAGLNVYYLPSIKGLLERSFSANSNSILKELIKQALSEGINPTKSSGPNQSKYFNKDTQKRFINKWVKKFGIGEKLDFGYDDKNGIYHITLDDRALIDYGYGVTQLISFLLLLGRFAEPVGDRDMTVIFEEPEANLHPNFQSKFIEMIVEAQNEFGLKFIIETHSEYLIRKLQYLTAKKEIKPEDSVIYYFHHPDNVPVGEEQVKKLEIRKDGMMDGDFGEGFFDESIRLTVDLLKLQNKN